MTSLRVLGFCGIVSASLTTLGGGLNLPVLVGLGGLIMLFGNAHAIVKGNT